MRCPVCGRTIRSGESKCSCGFFMELVTPGEEELDSARIHQIGRERIKYSKEMLTGIGLIAIGIIIAAALLFVPGLSIAQRGIYASLGFILAIYGVYDTFSCHIRIKKLASRKSKGRVHY